MDKFKGYAFDKTFNFTRNFFLSSLASLFVFVTVTFTTYEIISDVVTVTKNNEFVKKQEKIVENDKNEIKIIKDTSYVLTVIYENGTSESLNFTFK